MGKEHRLPEEVAITLFRIIQEALRNVWRHSGATSAEINIEWFDKSTRVTVSDNGQGFTLPDKVGDLAKFGKLGLAGMQERAQLVGGTLAVQSAPGKGTTLTVEAPG
jgi:two-component system sensor histidine kinase DegS